MVVLADYRVSPSSKTSRSTSSNDVLGQPFVPLFCGKATRNGILDESLESMIRCGRQQELTETYVEHYGRRNVNPYQSLGLGYGVSR